MKIDEEKIKGRIKCMLPYKKFMSQQRWLDMHYVPCPEEPQERGDMTSCKWLSLVL